jgi:hypothetical protein
MKNKAHMFWLSEELSNQWVANGPLLVDLFFVISGFLMSHNFLKNSQQMEQIRADGIGANLNRFGRIVMQRYSRYTHLDYGQFYILIFLKFHFIFRLVPLYFIVALSVETAFSYLADASIFYMQDRSDLNCPR